MKDLNEFLRLLKDLATGTLVGLAIGMILCFTLPIPLVWILISSVLGTIGGRIYNYYFDKYFGEGSKIDIANQLSDLEKSRYDLDPVEYLTYKSALTKRMLFGDNYDKIFQKEWKHQQQYNHLKKFRPIDIEAILDEYRHRFDYRLDIALSRQMKIINSKYESINVDVLTRKIEIELKEKTERIFERFLNQKLLNNKQEIRELIKAELTSELDLLSLDLKKSIKQGLKDAIQEKNNSKEPIKSNVNPDAETKISSKKELSSKEVAKEKKTESKAVSESLETTEQTIDKMNTKLEEPPFKNKTRRSNKNKSNKADTPPIEPETKKDTDEGEDDGGILILDDFPKGPTPEPVILGNDMESGST